MTKDEANTVASAAAQDILDAIEALPEYLSDALSWRLFNDESIALSFIGESLRPAAAGPDRDQAARGGSFHHHTCAATRRWCSDSDISIPHAPCETRQPLGGIEVSVTDTRMAWASGVRAGGA